MTTVPTKLTPSRLEALREIAAAGETGLGFGRCSLAKRRELIAMGLTERLPARGFFEPVHERLTPLGKQTLQDLAGEE